ncbi:MAG: beta-lactamase family protein [Armatimonadetes bacterium]|nr:beta-lactamase family protein [Armatimonadota bacterium]
MFLLSSAVQADAIDRYLAKEKTRNHIPGLQVAVVRHGRIIKLKAYGKANLEWQVPMRTDTEMQIASTTKTFTGSALMLLVKTGKLSLQDSARKFLPSLPKDWDAVKIFHLAGHSSGVPEAEGLNTQSTVGDAVAKLSRLQLTQVPGESSGYASSDYILLAAIIEKLSGESYPRYLSRHIFEPLRMESTRFDFATELGPIRTSELLPKRSSIYRWNGTSQTPFSFLYPIHAYAAGGLYSSASDLAKWAIALDKKKLLDREAQQTMWSQQKLNNGDETSWGIGWVVRTYEGRRVAGHSGGPALSDFLRFLDDDLSIVVLQNQQRMYPYLAQGIADLILPPRPKRADKTLSEPNPQMGAKYERFIRGLGEGKLDTELFAANTQELVDDSRNLVIPFASSQGKMTALRLVKNEIDDGGRTAVYEGTYGRKIILWFVSLDKQGLITSLNMSTP